MTPECDEITYWAQAEPAARVPKAIPKDQPARKRIAKTP